MYEMNVEEERVSKKIMSTNKFIYLHDCNYFSFYQIHLPRSFHDLLLLKIQIIVI